MRLLCAKIKPMLAKSGCLALIFSFVLSNNIIGAVNGIARTIYVSSTEGESGNSGTAPETPCLSIKEALSLEPDTILLHAGDVFYETVRLSNVVLSRYGEGPNPSICGFRIIPRGKWNKEDDNIWSLDLTDIGHDGFKVNGSSLLNNIGCFYERPSDEVHGGKVQYKSDLKRNWDFWQTDEYSKEINPSEFDKVYLYLKDNPNSYELECSVGTVAMITSNSQVMGVNVIGFGFGIVGRSNTVIRNCKIDIIGGMVLLGYNKFAPYGNGIEFNVSYNNCSDCLVEDCLVSRTYDSGITIQASKISDSVPRNIIIRNNLLYRCCQGWEDYLQNPDPAVRFYNCRFEDNLVLDCGNTGFNYPDTRVNYCSVLGYNSKGNKGMLIKNNTFIGGNYYCSAIYDSAYKSNIWEDNTCYTQRGSYILSNHDGTKNSMFMTLSRRKNLNLQTEYSELTGDTTTIFIVRGKRYIRSCIQTEFNKYILKHQY